MRYAAVACQTGPCALTVSSIPPGNTVCRPRFRTGTPKPTPSSASSRAPSASTSPRCSCRVGQARAPAYPALAVPSSIRISRPPGRGAAAFMRSLRRAARGEAARRRHSATVHQPATCHATTRMARSGSRIESCAATAVTDAFQASGNVSHSNCNGAALATANARGMSQRAVSSRRSSSPSEASTRTSGSRSTTFGSASQARVSRKMSVSAALPRMRSSKSSPRRQSTRPAASATTHTMPTSHQRPDSARGSRTSRATVVYERPPVIRNWALG